MKGLLLLLLLFNLIIINIIIVVFIIIISNNKIIKIHFHKYRFTKISDYKFNVKYKI